MVTSLGMMLLYSPGMTLIAVLVSFAYALLRALWYPSLRQSSEDTWDASARESSHFLETLNGILSLRINGVIAQREAAWLNLNVTRRNTQLRQSRLSMCYNIAHTLTASLVSAVILWKGAGEVLNGTFTVGMLVAYLSYQGLFSASISNLTDKVFSWRMLDIYNERRADIVMSPAEDQLAQNVPGDINMQGMPQWAQGALSEEMSFPLSLEQIAFSHKGSNAQVIREISLTLNPGEVVAITGKSGYGKSTLVKLILGIHTPDEGVIRTFGIPHTHPDYFQVRQRIGTVLQDDHLFRGSVADFNEERNQERVMQCAKLALIDSEIMAMPWATGVNWLNR